MIVDEIEIISNFFFHLQERNVKGKKAERSIIVYQPLARTGHLDVVAVKQEIKAAHHHHIQTVLEWIW